ncbi:MAG: cold shock domain-containing protein [Hyphomonadaceae bacterium]
MTVGTVEFFNSAKGFGFIAPEGGAKDVFVHVSAVERAGLSGLADRTAVSFDLRLGSSNRAES